MLIYPECLLWCTGFFMGDCGGGPLTSIARTIVRTKSKSLRIRQELGGRSFAYATLDRPCCATLIDMLRSSFLTHELGTASKMYGRRCRRNMRSLAIVRRHSQGRGHAHTHPNSLPRIDRIQVAA